MVVWPAPGGGAAHRGRDPAPVTPVDPQVASAVAREISETRRNIATRVDLVRLQVETHNAAGRIREAVKVNDEIKAQERMQLLQDVEFAAVCSKRASEAGLQTEQQREEVRRLWVEGMVRRGEGQLAESAFAMHGPTGMPLEEQQRALRRAIRIANLGEAAGRGHGGGGITATEGGGAGNSPRRPRSAEEAGEGDRSRSKSVRPRGGARARREGGGA